MNRSTIIFGNEMSRRDCRKAQSNKSKLAKKHGDDSGKVYHLKAVDNAVIGGTLGVKTLVMSDTPLEIDKEKSVIIGNIRMGFGHYRISMALASAANSMGYTPYWLDLNSFEGTAATNIISAQNELYSLGSRLSQKSFLFNKLVWEPVNTEMFRRLSYNCSDQMMTSLMTGLYADLPKDIPFVAAHAWPAQAAVHAGLTNVVNAIPDNWPMALHLSEGAVHTVQTQSSYMGYKVLRGMDKKRLLKSMPEGSVKYTGHYIDHEIVSNIEADCAARISRAKEGKPMRFLFTIGGAGAQGEFFAAIIKTLLPFVSKNKACIYINCGDYENVWTMLKEKIPEFADGSVKTKLHFNDWQEELKFADTAIEGLDTDAGSGVHVFCNKDIFGAVYITNLLMRASDILVTKPSELAFYPVPKLFIRRIGGHEMWGAIHSAELGDGTQECETPEFACSIVEMLLKQPSLIETMCNNIINEKKKGTYDGAYKAVKIAAGISEGGKL